MPTFLRCRCRRRLETRPLNGGTSSISERPRGQSARGGGGGCEECAPGKRKEEKNKATDLLGVGNGKLVELFDGEAREFLELVDLLLRELAQHLRRRNGVLSSIRAHVRQLRSHLLLVLIIMLVSIDLMGLIIILAP